MTLKRLWWSFRIATIRGGSKRADYARKKRIYGAMGSNVMIQKRVVPLYSELIKFHNNISVARNVDFVTHDVIHSVLNRVSDTSFSEMVGCIEIMDNVFIGSNSVILYNTRIGPNVIVASGSVVTKDCEPNSVYAGVPAKRIGSLAEYIKRRAESQERHLIATTKHNQALTDEEIKEAWKIFDTSHSSHNK